MTTPQIHTALPFTGNQLVYIRDEAAKTSFAGVEYLASVALNLEESEANRIDAMDRLYGMGMSAPVEAKPIPKSWVRVSTREYRSNHSAEPRGRGSWAFFMGEAPDNYDARDERIWWSPSCTFAEARKLAVAEAARQGIAVVEVLS